MLGRPQSPFLTQHHHIPCLSSHDYKLALELPQPTAVKLHNDTLAHTIGDTNSKQTWTETYACHQCYMTERMIVTLSAGSTVFLLLLRCVESSVHPASVSLWSPVQINVLQRFLDTMLPRTVFQVLLLAYIASITNGQFNCKYCFMSSIRIYVNN